MRATVADIITRNGGTVRIPDETLVREVKELCGICDRFPHLIPVYADYVRHMQNGDAALARIAKAFIRSYSVI
jgi:hypothetical protein